MTRPANPSLVSGILRSASDLIAEKGPDGVTLREVAARVGVTTTTLHYYFGSKDGLMAAVRAAALEALSAALTAAGAGDAPAAEQLRAVGRAFVGWTHEAPHRYTLVFAVTSAGAAGTVEHSDARHILRARLREILEFGRRRGELTFDDAELQASLALCWLAGVAVVASARFRPTEQQTAAEALLDGALSAFLAPISSGEADARPEARQVAAVAEIRSRRSAEPPRPAEARELSDDELEHLAAAGLQDGSFPDSQEGSS
ncbi:MAG: TetR/AcrR family transcriptional regulator [Actinomycetes bacterium]